MSEAKTFEYSYSADRAKEVEAIRKKYVNKEEDKFEVLKRLDKQAEQRGMITALMLGIIGTLVLGAGMSITMVGSTAFYVLGIIIGIVGIVILGVSYPLYKKMVAKDRAQVSDQILKLTEELQ